MEEGHEIARRLDRLMRRFGTRLTREMPKLDKERTGPFGGMVLLYLADQDSIALRELVHSLQRDPSQVTRITLRLEQKGLITRSTDKDDRRHQRLKLTSKGWEFVDRALMVMSVIVDDLLVDLNPEDRADLLRILTKLG